MMGRMFYGISKKYLDEERREGKYTLGWWWYVCEVVVGVKQCSTNQMFPLIPRTHARTRTAIMGIVAASSASALAAPRL